MSNVFVTGGTGFIGQHLVRVLLNQGHSVSILVRDNSRAENLRNSGCYFKYDLDNMDRYDYIYHLAGVLGKNGLPWTVYEEPHVEMLWRLVQNCKGHLVYFSSAYTQTDKLGHYTETKRLGETLIQTHKGRFSIIRPGFVYGPGDIHHLPLFRWVKKLGSLFPIQGSGNNLICPTYIGDVVNNLTPEMLPHGAVTIAGEPTTMNRFIGLIAQVLEVRRPMVRIPPLVKRDFFTKTRVFKSDVPSTPVEIGLREAVSWYRTQGLL